MSKGAPQGTAKHIKETGSVPTGNVDLEDVPTIQITKRALAHFRYRHGGGDREAEVQLRTMLEDFLLKSARNALKGGSLMLAKDGYALILSPGRDAITGYSTSHRERTWEQVKAGVKSRYKKGGMARDASGPAPERGPAVALSEFESEFRPADVHLTGRVRGSYAKIAGLGMVSDEDLDASIRAACAEFRSDCVVQRDDGCFEVNLGGRTWLVSTDCRSLFGVKRAPASHTSSDQHAALESPDISTGRQDPPSPLHDGKQTARHEKVTAAAANKRVKVKAGKGSISKRKPKKNSKDKSFDDPLLEYWNKERLRDERIDSRPKRPWLGLATRVTGVTSGGLPGGGRRH